MIISGMATGSETFQQSQNNEKILVTLFVLLHLTSVFIADITGDSPQEMYEILSMSEVLEHLIESFKPFIQVNGFTDSNGEEWKKSWIIHNFEK